MYFIDETQNPSKLPPATNNFVVEQALVSHKARGYHEQPGGNDI